MTSMVEVAEKDSVDCIAQQQRYSYFRQRQQQLDVEHIGSRWMNGN